MIKKYLIKESTALSQLLFVVSFLSITQFIIVTDIVAKAVYLLIFTTGVGFGGLLSVHKEKDYKPPRKRKK